MKKTVELNSIEYTVTTCTAIAECNEGNEAARQDALLVIAKAESEIAEHIVFGWDMPENAEDFEDVCEDSGAWEALSDEHRLDVNGMSYEQYRESIYGWLTQTPEMDYSRN